MVEILQQISDRGTRCKKDVILEQFLKFQPPTFSGEGEQDQQAEQWVAQIEDIFQTLSYSE
jgi:hypothetical protein